MCTFTLLIHNWEMNRNIFFLLVAMVLLAVVSACKPSSELDSIFSCQSSTISLSSLETITDYQNNFSVEIPKNWKTQFYFNDIQSEIISADTIKDLSDSYIMDFSMVSAPITIDTVLRSRIEKKGLENHLNVVKNKFYTYKGKKGISFLSKKVKQDPSLYLFQSYLKVSDSKYLYTKIEFYGDTNVNTRLCEAISIMNTLEIINTNK